ncbi:MAG: hypothetical protein AAF772_14510 [Acidobacteriota bacterium]
MGKKRTGRSPTVRRRDGRCEPFLRGMVTHELVQRGLHFDEAYAVARSLRQQVSARGEITTRALRKLIEAELRATFDPARLAQLAPSHKRRRKPILQVCDGEIVQPFSRGLLARSLTAAGLDFDRAYRLTAEVQRALRRDGLREVDRAHIAREAAAHLARDHGDAAATRYRLLRRIRTLPRPLILYLGGVSGAGKSTLALELGPLLRVYRVIATDTIREVMRSMVTPTLLPALHRSSFDPFSDRADDDAAEPTSERAVIAHFDEQARRVAVGVRAVVERAVAENVSVIVEGVHLVPPAVPFADLDDAAIQVPILLFTEDADRHRMRFVGRGHRSERPPMRYLEREATIRALQRHLIERAEAVDVPLVDTSDNVDVALARTVRTITGVLRTRLPDGGDDEPEKKR